MSHKNIRQSPRISSKMANRSLLKAALTKNVTLSDTITPNTSTITPNTTAMEIEKVKRHHNQMQITPRTVLAEKPPLENSGNVLDTNELFNTAKAATNGRREKRSVKIDCFVVNIFSIQTAQCSKNRKKVQRILFVLHNYYLKV